MQVQQEKKERSMVFDTLERKRDMCERERQGTHLHGGAEDGRSRLASTACRWESGVIHGMKRLFPDRRLEE